MNRPFAILVHGMGRTPVSMALLAHRLRVAGFDTASFGYVPAVEKFASCVQRLRRFIDARAGSRPCVLIGHSLGTVLLRSVLAHLARPPAACFFIGPPTSACVLARRFAGFLPYRLITGEMGQLLATQSFLEGVPIPQCPAYIYAGTGGPRWRFYPLGDEPNDGILKVSETRLSGIPLILIDAQHTFLMNSRALVRDLTDKALALVNTAPGLLRNASS
jgi:pimeloyl-ACP methyl ester carboxylesterase